MARFNTDIGRFDYPNSGLNRPEELGCFSLDINREFHDDTSQRKYFIKPSNYDNVSFDLTKGYEGMVKRDEFKDEQIDHLLKWINNHELGNMQTHFICRRGLLNRLMRTMYAKKDDWKFAVSLHKGSADSDPSPDLQYNNCETFYTVVKATIGSHTLVYSGEVDAVSTDEPFGEHYVEFKTITHSALQRNSFKRYKLRNWWTQSVLVGVPEIVCGLRDDAGIVTKLQTYTTQDLPTMASDIPAPWKPNVCFNFLDKLLDFIKSNVTIDDPRLVHLLEFSGRDATCNRLPRDSEYAFLHKWYTHN
ncbi:decapping and exoribonuclease protein-like isoform X2 [Mya arenaria]|uniref:decapping and exoribonuclease protein-like isoform X2 n=1 Tax=Mya arenaria TaxID=6604 RepID=UPI0022E8334D|nr:decapping and exoribonuclease protein-like isoform X2 [Mya arenaria]